MTQLLYRDGNNVRAEVTALNPFPVTIAPAQVGQPAPAVSVASQGYSAQLTVTRPNDTNAYGAGDVIGASTGAGGAIHTFPNMGPANGRILITATVFQRNVVALISGESSYNLYLFDAAPASMLGDNGVMDIAVGDRANYLGKIALGTPVDEVSTIVTENYPVNKQVKLGASGNLYGYIATVGGYTPVALTVHVITIHSVSL